MSNINEKAQRIFERRQELDDKRKQLELYVEKILDVFEASNFEVSKFVWKLYLHVKEDYLACKISFVEAESDTTKFLNKSSLLVHTPRMQLLHSMQNLDKMKIPKEMLDKIHLYFKTTLSKYFTVVPVENESFGIVITLKKDINCENV